MPQAFHQRFLYHILKVEGFHVLRKVGEIQIILVTKLLQVFATNLDLSSPV